MKPCRHPGCPRLTDGMYCEEHARLHASDRASASVRGYNGRWEKARTRFLKAHPLCVRCMEQGRLTRATVVDHIIPHRGDARPCFKEKCGSPAGQGRKGADADADTESCDICKGFNRA